MRNIDDTTVKLTYPVTVEGVATDHITLRRPKVRDMLAAEKGSASSAAQEVTLFANLAEVAPAVIEALDLVDYLRLQKVYASFLSSGPRTPDAPASSSLSTPGGG